MPRRAFECGHVFIMASILSFVLLGLSHTAFAQVSVPPELEPWRGWVLQDQKHLGCPFRNGADLNDLSSYRCAWPERLSIAVDAQGGTFSQRWQVYTESWVQLPGNFEHWPQQVTVNGKPGAVVLRQGMPMLRLFPGEHSISGRWTWASRPESLHIPTESALVDLTIDGKAIASPERPEGALWLGKRRAAEQPQRMEIQVYRLVRDEVPARLVTTIRIQASGEGREELLSRVLPDGFTPVSLQSPLPARLEADGRLRVQVRAGSWDITLDARGQTVASTFKRPPLNGPWAKDEVWSFAGDDRLRVAAAQGADGMDPAQANVPEEWRSYPAYRIAQEATLSIVQRSRGLETVDDNRLTLNRRLWLDFNHEGFTAIDQVSGTLRSGWRLDMRAPYRLENAKQNGDTLLVTQSADPARAGVELRSQNLQLTTVARSGGSRGALPATGWDARFDEVKGELNLPPGHRLLAALGADRAPRAWIESWGLWDLFGVLTIAVIAAWLAGWPVGLVTLAALLLTYQESPEYVWLWANLLAAVALARGVAPGKFKTFANVYRRLSFVVLGVALLPFLWGQLLLAVYPQLDRMTMPVPGAAAAAPVQTDLSVTNIAPPAVMMDMPAQAAADSAAASAMEEAVVARKSPYPLESRSATFGLNFEQVVQRYAPGTLLQSGPGIPSWRFRVYQYSWSGPVDAEQTVRFLYIGPFLVGLWRIVGVALLAALFVRFWKLGSASKPNGWRLGRPAVAALACGTLSVLFGLASPHANAASPPAPNPDILEELKDRLTQPPSCAPTCADIMSANVSVTGDRLSVDLNVSALAAVAVAMPSATDRWQIESITVDGQSSLAMGREGDGALWVPLKAGAHRILLSGRLAPAQSIQLSFPAQPRHIAARGEGWDITGINDSRLLSGSLELVRRRGSSEGLGNLEAASEFPVFVKVHRRFDLSLDWSLRTTVERIAPEKAAVSVEVPLVEGESVLTNAVQTRDRLALVGLERGQQSLEWASGLPRAELLELQLPENASRTEVWSFVVSPQWNVEFAGFPAVTPVSLPDGQWVFEFHPRPGEKLQLKITRPQAAKGATFAIDSVKHRVEYGKRSTSNFLSFQYRSTQGGRHVIQLPESARVSGVLIDGNPSALRPDKGELSLSLMPGSHEVTISWTEAQGIGMRARASAVDLGAPASNVQTTLQLPEDRWALFAYGPGFGPAILYWAELVIFVLVAVFLGRWSESPLRTHEWLILGFGLSTLSWSILVLVGVWLFAMRWRSNWSAQVSRWQFNAIQIALVVLTVIAVSSLVFSGVRQSLLASPDMSISGLHSYGAVFGWFVDRTHSALPEPLVFSVPMWVYRAVMFAWALWIAIALIRWLSFAWRAWNAQGFWKGGEDTDATVPG